MKIKGYVFTSLFNKILHFRGSANFAVLDETSKQLYLAILKAVINIMSEQHVCISLITRMYNDGGGGRR